MFERVQQACNQSAALAAAALLGRTSKQTMKVCVASSTALLKSHSCCPGQIDFVVKSCHTGPRGGSSWFVRSLPRHTAKRKLMGGIFLTSLRHLSSMLPLPLAFLKDMPPRT